ncbi:MAG TPA: hypothetical protein VKU87_12775 [Thermomicrobiaceae bacterium]|nr:hypothetical protein [Thermomicrobiaceae bacterium]
MSGVPLDVTGVLLMRLEAPDFVLDAEAELELEPLELDVDAELPQAAINGAIAAASPVPATNLSTRRRDSVAEVRVSIVESLDPILSSSW